MGAISLYPLRSSPELRNPNNMINISAMNRRELIKATAGLAAGIAMNQLKASFAAPASRPAPSDVPTARKLPRWRGFNLTEMFMPGSSGGKFVESDFDIIKDWGFDFVRLPCSYWFWAKPETLYEINEAPLKFIDQAIEMGRERGIHMNLCMHRIPGYCINPPEEPTNLFKDDSTLAAAAFHWQMFAKRYKGISSRELSFDLMNEPPSIDDATYLRIHAALVKAIREVDPDRLIIADGKGGGHTPVGGVAALGIAMSTRGYMPFRVSHHKASWVAGSDKWPEPTWPLREENAAGKFTIWNKAQLRKDRIVPWKAVEATGVGIHIGEWGVFNRTPHDVALAWMKDNLELFEEAGWGWALWNMRGGFGVMDSDRQDVQYEDFRGHKLDRKMLELLRQH
jgi:endoglucanase